jgi:hypothetical protein
MLSLMRQCTRSNAHEGSDLPLKPFLIVVLGLLGTAVIIYLAIFVFVRVLVHSGSTFRAIYRPGAASLEQFPRPEIQVDPDQELRTYLAREEKEINSYGWIDRAKGSVHLPIQKAMELLLARGVLIRPAEQGPTEVELQQQKGQQKPGPNAPGPTQDNRKEKR